MFRKISIVSLLFILGSSLFSCSDSGNGNTLPELPLLDPPKSINASASDGSVLVSWPAVDKAKQYQVYYREDIDNVEGEFLSLDLINQTDIKYTHSVTNGNQYAYTVSTINDEDKEGVQSVASDTVSPSGAPLKPVFTSTTKAEDRINILTWVNVKDITYNLAYREGGNDVAILKNLISPYNHTNLKNGVQYTYYLIATNALNLENSSPKINLTPLAKPLEITSITAVAGSGQSTIKWLRNPAQPLSQVDIYGVLTLKYKIYREEKNAQGKWINSQLITDPPISVSTYTDIDVKTFTSYRYTVSQINNNKNEGGINATVFATVTPTGTLDATSELLMTIEPTQLMFSWTPVIGATEYRLLSYGPNASGFTEIGQRIPAPATVVNIEIAVHQHQWGTRYTLEACNGGGCGLSSNEVNTLNRMLTAIGYFKAFNTGISDQFGSAAAISKDGNTLAIGALWEGSSTIGVNNAPNDAGDNSGAVYVYSKVAGQWQRQAFIKASNTETGDAFGVSVSISDDGNTLAVGARFESSDSKVVTPGNYTIAKSNNNASGSGAVYVFTRAGTTWTQHAYIKASNSELYDSFGTKLSLSGDGLTLAISSSENSAITGVTPGSYTVLNDNGKVLSGAVYVYSRSGTTWTPQAFIKSFNSDAMDHFGSSIALNQSGTSLVVGARFEDSSTSDADPESFINQNNLARDSGAVYVFTRSATIWTQKGYIKSLNTGAGDQLGFSVAISDDGNTIAAGAFFEDSIKSGVDTTPEDSQTNLFNSGATYVFTRSNTVWTQQAYIKSNNTGKEDYFGWSLSLSGDGNTLLVGAPTEDSSTLGVTTTSNEGATDSGAVYTYSRSGSTWSFQSFIKALNTGSSDEFGDVVSLNRDGSKLVVGAHKENSATFIADIVNKPPSGISDLSGAVYLY